MSEAPKIGCGFIDRTGSRRGTLLVESYSHFDGKFHQWNVVCECGVRKIMSSPMLSSRKTKSCGCKTKEILSKARTIHGHAKLKTKTYAAWHSMHLRCTLKSRSDWDKYGGRGIVVCDRWNSFEAFLADMGEAKTGESLDRIDCNGNYEPSNCRWANAKQQANNRRNNNLITFNGITKTLSAWAESLGVRRDTLSHRIHSGMPLDIALSSTRLPTGGDRHSQVWEERHADLVKSALAGE